MTAFQKPAPWVSTAPFGPAGGAGGIHNDMGGVQAHGGGGFRLLSGLSGQGLFVSRGPGRFFISQDQQAPDRGLADQPLSRFRKPRVEDEGLGPAVGQVEGQFGRGKPPVQGHQQQAHFGRRKDHLHILQAVVGQQGAAVARFQPQGLEHAGKDD